MHQGYFLIGRPLLGIPLRVHWSAAFLVLVLGGPAHPHPIRWLGVVFLILVHEYGHALVARRVGAYPLGIEIHGMGGLCRCAGYTTPIGRACIASGGVWAQGIVLVAAIAIGAIVEPPEGTPLGELLVVLVVSNVVMAVFNLIPIPPLDGAEAWKLPWLLGQQAWRRLRSTWKERSNRRPRGPTLH